jgi:hypothetical protein
MRMMDAGRMRRQLDTCKPIVLCKPFHGIGKEKNYFFSIPAMMDHVFPWHRRPQRDKIYLNNQLYSVLFVKLQPPCFSVRVNPDKPAQSPCEAPCDIFPVRNSSLFVARIGNGLSSAGLKIIIHSGDSRHPVRSSR